MLEKYRNIKIWKVLMTMNVCWVMEFLTPVSKISEIFDCEQRSRSPRNYFGGENRVWKNLLNSRKITKHFWILLNDILNYRSEYSEFHIWIFWIQIWIFWIQIWIFWIHIWIFWISDLNILNSDLNILNSYLNTYSEFQIWKFWIQIWIFLMIF